MFRFFDEVLEGPASRGRAPARRRFGLPDEELGALVAAAEDAARSATDWFRFSA
jgi:uncharacterized tellurite resistance protein B-like protein